MVYLSCSCLNVKFHLKPNLVPTSPQSLLLDNDDPFLKQGILEAELNIGGILTRHEMLIQKRHLGDWIINKCISCGVETHLLPALHSTKQFPPDSVILSSILKDEKEIAKMEKSANFSEVFKILLDKSDLSLVPNQDVIAKNTLERLNEQVSRHIHLTEQQIEYRIQLFTEQQDRHLALVHDQAAKDKALMLSLLTKVNSVTSVADTSVSNSLTPPLTPEDYVPTDPLLEDAPSDQLPPLRDIRNRGLGMPFNKSVVSASRRINVRSRVRNYKGHTQSLDTEGMFDIDELDNKSPQAMSDEELYLEDDEREEFYGANKNVDSYVTSLPVLVPNPRTGARNVLEDDDNLNQGPIDPEDIAASINELARSIRRDDRDVFGDLPRPRLNTYS